MSLDGFIAGPNINSSQPMGENGERLHDWLFGAKTDIDQDFIREFENSGAVIVGGKTYHDAIDVAWGGVTPFTMPAFVLTSRVPSEPKTGFTFITDGIERALIQARAAAGAKNVWVMGGANTIQQFIRARMFDEIGIHIAPILLGSGTRLFDNTEGKIGLENIQTIQTPAAIHMKFRPVA